MRKRCKRVPRPVSLLITPSQHMGLVLVPRMHLEMMLTQTVNMHYQRSVLGMFDLAVALAILQNKPQTRDRFEMARQIMYLLIHGSRKPDVKEADFLCRSFNQADQYFGIQSRAMLIRAFDFVDMMIADYKEADITDRFIESGRHNSPL